MNQETLLTEQPLRRYVSPTKLPGIHSPRGPRPASASNEKGPVQVMKSATEPISTYHGPAIERWVDKETMIPTEYSQSQDGSLTRLEPVRQTSFEPLRSGTPVSVASAPASAAKLWDSLRQHVVTPPVRPPTPSQQSTRSTTPKPSRLQKLGLRQLVEDVTTMRGGMWKFAEDILRACNIARYGEIQKPTTREREGSASSPPNFSGRRLDYLRRPLSIASLSSSTQASSPPSLRHLYQMLVHYATSIKGGQVSAQFPYESRVLSTLLCPFLSRTSYPASRLEEEQLTAMDAFDLLSNSWAPADEVILTDRLLWCTKAAATSSSHPARTRLLTSLRKQFLPPSEGPGLRLSAHEFRSLMSSLFLLLASLQTVSAPFASPTSLQSPSSPAAADLHLVQDSINKVLSGSLELDEQSIVEEYGAKLSSADRKGRDILKRALSIEAMLHCIENCQGPGESLLQSTIEQYWPSRSDRKFTRLQATICSRRLDTFCRIFQTSLQSPLNISPTGSPLPERIPSVISLSSLDAADNIPDSHLFPRLVLLLKTKVLPEAEALSGAILDDQIVSRVRSHIARLLFHLTRLNVDERLLRTGLNEDVFGGSTVIRSDSMEHSKWAVQLLTAWYKAGASLPWGAVLESTLRQLIQEGWQTSIPVLLSLLRHLPDDIKKNVMSAIFPFFNDQLVNDPPLCPYPEMSVFLSTLSRTWPPLFYKPLFACAASDKEVIVVNHLCTIQVHSKYVSDYWTRDPEMLCVALLSDIGMTDTESGNDKWAKARLGQLVLLVELIGRVQKLRHEKENSTTESDPKFSAVFRFVLTLEAQLWKLMEAKEKKSLIPPSQRMFLCILLREFRLMTRSLKPAPWLSTTLQWFNDFCADVDIGLLDQEVTESIQRVQGLYMAGQSGVQQIHKRHTSMLAKSVLKTGLEKSTEKDNFLDLAGTFVEHRKLIDSLSKGYIPRAMKLFVTLSLIIFTEDFRRLGTTLWQHCLLDNSDTSATASASFLLMRCAEKAPMDILPAIEVDLHASDDITRLEAVRKIAVLVNWRYQIWTQNFLTDRTHRPFRLGRPPHPFVATDLGSSVYIPLEEVTQNRDKDDVPYELRKRLEELGWVEEDARPVDPRQEIIQAPLSILPLDQVDLMEVGGEGLASSNSPLPTPQPSPRRNQTQQTLQTVDDAAALLRRNSSTGGPIGGLKRRAIFVPSLSSVFVHLSRLVFDTNLSIASAARTTLLDVMRSDPALLARTVLEQLAGENKDIRFVMSTFSALLHVRRVLPPPLAHYLFNHLGGFLKYVMRHVQTSEALADFGEVMPVITSLATQVSGLSMRGIRRSKMEHIFTPSGSLWFSSSAPRSLMLPRMLEDSKFPPQSIPPHLFSISMVRASQNLFFLAMLKRNYKDVQAIRKNMSNLVLPSLDDASRALELRDFVSGKASSQMALHHTAVNVLSLMVARGHILLVAQILRSLPRHLSDRSELAILVDGLNRCLLIHGDDISIVSHVLIALMVASARFKRLFLTGAGYTLFMPALVKVYTEQSAHFGIRSALEYAISRFYVLHREAFLYQSIHIIGQVAMLPEVDAPSFSRGVFDLFASLRKQATPSSVDVAGIHDVNKAEEREAYLFHTADETPQTFLAAMRRKDSQSGGLHMILQLPQDYEEARLDMDDFVRLLLTVIAHDLTICRAQYFLRLLRYIAPYLYNASASTRIILADGIMALGSIITKALSKPKGGELSKSLPDQEDVSIFSAGPGLENLVNETTKVPSESKMMRMDFLYLVLAFGQAGGMVSPLLALQAIDVTRSLLKDLADAGIHEMAVYLNDFVKMLFIREEALGVKGVVAVLHRLAPVFHAFMMVDFTGVFETILRILPVPIYSHDSAFSQVIVGDICSAGLAACDLAASENQLMDLPYRTTFVCLLAEAVFLRDVDIIAQLEKRRPTHQFLAGVILPLALVLKTGAQIFPDSTRTDFHRRMLTNAWIRLLFYSISACQQSQRGGGDIISSSASIRSKSSDGQTQKGSSRKSQLSILAIGLQVIKMIVIRGSEDISSVPRLGVWDRLAIFLQVTLKEGNADFALKQEPNSTATTPAGSPRSSTQFDVPGSSSGYNLFVSTSSGLNPPGSPLAAYERSKPTPRPRLIDYCLWSVLEFVCAYRSPLRIHLKLLAADKVLAIHQELRRITKPNGTSFPSSPSVRRISASIGLRARHRASARDFPSSPDSSPYLQPSQSNLSPSPPHLLSSPSRLSPSPVMPQTPSPGLDIPLVNPRRPGYAISPVTPQERAPNWPKIVHLGPTSPSVFLPAPSPLIGLGLRRFSRASNSQADPSTDQRSPAIQSESLCEATYQRIRGVQVFLGYRTLLPLPSSKSKFEMDEGEDAFLLAWTRSQAITSVVEETNALLEEFEDSSQIETSSITFDIEPSTPTPITTTVPVLA